MQHGEAPTVLAGTSHGERFPSPWALLAFRSLLGYALLLERRSGVARIVPTLPHAVIGIVWLTAYKIRTKRVSTGSHADVK